MKKYVLLISVIAGFHIGGIASAERPIDGKIHQRTMGLSLNTLQFFFFAINGKYYLKMNDQLALTIPFIVSHSPELVIKLPDGSVVIPQSNYFGSGVGLKYYFTESVFSDGLYGELELSAGYSLETPPNLASFSSPFLKTTGLFGYSWVFADCISLGLAIGGYYNHAFSHEAPVLKKVTTGPHRLRYVSAGLISGFNFTSEFSVGYNW